MNKEENVSAERDPELGPDVEWLMARVADTVKLMTEASRRRLMSRDADVCTWRETCRCHLDMVITLATLIGAVNAHRGAQPKLGFGTNAFNPVDGSTGLFVLRGDIERDCMPVAKACEEVNDDDNAEGRFQDVRMAAAAWAIAQRVGTAEDDDTPVEQIAEALGLDAGRIEVVTYENGKRKEADNA